MLNYNFIFINNEGEFVIDKNYKCQDKKTDLP